MVAPNLWGETSIHFSQALFGLLSNIARKSFCQDSVAAGGWAVVQTKDIIYSVRKTVGLWQ